MNPYEPLEIRTVHAFQRRSAGAWNSVLDVAQGAFQGAQYSNCRDRYMGELMRNVTLRLELRSGSVIASCKYRTIFRCRLLLVSGFFPFFSSSSIVPL